MNFIDIIYPPVCGFCGKISKNRLCKKCEIRYKNQSACKIESYKDTSSYFDEHIYLFQYDGEIRDIIIKYKFEEKPYIYESFVKFIENNEKICNQIVKYDIITPVPISQKRYKERGYNQSDLLAMNIAKSINKKDLNKAISYKKTLVKIKDNQPQSTLSQEERAKNVIGVYEAKTKENFTGKKVLLVDDIFTTGNTVNECSRILKNIGVKSIGIFTIAKD